MTEAQLHRSVAEYLSAVLFPSVAWTTMPAGGGGKIRGAMLKGTGLKPGWPDIQLVYRGRYYGIELKVKRGRLSPAQETAQQWIGNAGGHIALARSIDDVRFNLRAWGFPMREARETTERTA